MASEHHSWQMENFSPISSFGYGYSGVVVDTGANTAMSFAREMEIACF
jgi:hypothetical protein